MSSLVPGVAVLALETSCDETSAAIVVGGRVLANVVSSQNRLHAEYGGVVPELAAREHLRNLSPILDAAFEQAGIQSCQLEGVAATRGPGLPAALMVGLKAAQAIAFARQLPFFGIHHHEAHLYSPLLHGDPPVADFTQLRPFVGLVVSGGHTLLVHVPEEGRNLILGETVDDAAGECFDKTAKLMGLAYPGGPEIDRLAAEGNPNAVKLPRPMLRESHDDFSFSGLKTAVRYFLRDHPGAIDSRAALTDLCASVQAAIVEVLVEKTLRAATRLGLSLVMVSGGVACNRGLRTRMLNEGKQRGIEIRLAEPRFCTDNAAMIGTLAERKFARGEIPTSLDEDIAPSLTLGERVSELP